MAKQTETETLPAMEGVEKESRRLKALEDFNRFERVSREEGGVLSLEGASRVLAVSPTRVRQLIRDGQLTRVEFPSLKLAGVTVSSVRRRVQLRDGLLIRGGRPNARKKDAGNAKPGEGGADE